MTKEYTATIYAVTLKETITEQEFTLYSAERPNQPVLNTSAYTVTEAKPVQFRLTSSDIIEHGVLRHKNPTIHGINITIDAYATRIADNCNPTKIIDTMYTDAPLDGEQVQTILCGGYSIISQTIKPIQYVLSPQDISRYGRKEG